MSFDTSKLSVVIMTKNNDKTLEDTLKSVHSYTDDIVIVDMHSTDDTVKIAKKYDAKVFLHKILLYADPARNFALSKAKNPWILVIDADETIQESFVKTLEDITSETFSKVKEADTYWLPRKNMIWGKWIEHTGWWPDYQLRLFRNGKATWQGDVHQTATPLGTTEYLPSSEDLALVHQNYPSIESYLERLNRYTTLQADQTKKTAKSPSDLLKAFFGEFEARFFVHEGIKDGAHGLALSLYQGMYEMSVLLKKAEKQGFDLGQSTENETLKTVSKMKNELSYWIADYKAKHSSFPENFIWKIRRKFSW